MKSLKNLVKYELESINHDGIVVKRHGKNYTINFEPDAGVEDESYCELRTQMYLENSAIITNVKYEKIDAKEWWETNTCKVVFYNNETPIAAFYAKAWNEDNWYSGVCLAVSCEELNFYEKVLYY